VAGPDLVVANKGSLAKPEGSLTVIDAATGVLVRALASPYLKGPGDLVSSGGDVFVANTSQSPGSVTELDPATGQVLRTLAGGPYGFGDILAMAVSGTDLFVANLGSASTGSWVSEVDLASGKPARTLLSSPLSAGPPEAMTTSGPDLFVSYRGVSHGFGGGFGSAAGGSLTEVDVTSGATVRVVSGSRYHLGDGGAMASFGPSLYVANSDGGSVTERRARPGAQWPRLRLRHTRRPDGGWR
jgi:DNA-binding beta-propeller fold protein YncE